MWDSHTLDWKKYSNKEAKINTSLWSSIFKHSANTFDISDERKTREKFLDPQILFTVFLKKNQSMYCAILNNVFSKEK